MEGRSSKIIVNPGMARHLLRKGAVIIDLKPSRENPIATVFVFLKDEKFKKAMDEINESLHAVIEKEEPLII